MNENNGRPEHSDEKINADVKIKLPTSEKLSNFWYHYKWHTIVSVFVVIVITIITLQLCSREKYDIYILYAGDKAITNSSSDGNVPERTKFLNAFSGISSDFDGNGEISVAFKSLYTPDDEEIQRRKDEGLEIPESLIFEDNNTLSSLIAQSDFYLLFLDEAVFRKYAENSVMIGVVEPYLPAGFTGEIVKQKNSSGIYLKDTGFYELEGIRDLPEDTVVCIKYANAFASDADEMKREQAIGVFKIIAAMK